MTTARKGRTLTPKQQRFVAEYAVDLNASQAARRAGYSVKSSEDIGTQLLRKPLVVQAIAERSRVLTERTGVRSEEILNELQVIGYSDAWNYTVDAEGYLTLAAGVPESAKRAVASVKYRTRLIPQKDGPPITERDVEFRLWDKNAALTNLAKHKALLIERHEINITQQHLIAVRGMSDLELGAFLAALDQQQPEEALRLLPGGAA